MGAVRNSSERLPHVGVNAHLLSLEEGYRSAGITSYIFNLLRHLPGTAAEMECTVFLSERRYEGPPGQRLQVSRLPTNRPPVRILWEQALLPWIARREGIDLLHNMAFVGPLASTCPFVVTVHDLSFLFFPHRFRSLRRSYLQVFARMSVHRARRVIAVSESTKHDLVEIYGISPAKIDVVHNGVDASFRPLPADQVTAFRQQRGLPDRFVLFVGTLEPRKNIVGLIEAYAKMPKERPPLVLVGGKGWFYDEIFGRVEALELTGEVHFAGFVPAEELPWWYNAADLFVYPSVYEGFGLPPLEAMACGTAVITSTASSLPEVVGKAGQLVDPADTDALATAMKQVLSNRDLQEQMQAAGLDQAAGFSWEEAARQTVDSYRHALTPEEDRQGV
jgi:glycosyltransferase involved in cell wall biosynthesis